MLIFISLFCLFIYLFVCQLLLLFLLLLKSAEMEMNSINIPSMKSCMLYHLSHLHVL